MRSEILTFLKSEHGSDLVEYALILAFVCLAGAAMFIGMSTNEKSLWGIANSRLAAPNGIR